MLSWILLAALALGALIEAVILSMSDEEEVDEDADL